jgi:hypothetical protein
MHPLRLLLSAIIAMFWLAPVYADAPPLRGRVPEVYRLEKQLLPDTIELIEQVVKSTRLERRFAEYVSLSFGKDEYVYHAPDRVFIRVVKDRYELPAWRVCGDFALVRVELMDESMKTLGTVMGWSMIYRDGRWRRLLRGNEGQYTYDNLQAIVLPPYAARCFNLDRKELLDH